MRTFGIFLGLAILLGAFALDYRDGALFNGLNLGSFNFSSFSSTSTKLPTAKNSGATGSTKSTNPAPLSNQKIEEQVNQAYDKLDSLKEDVRDATLREPASPYAGMVSLQKGNVKETDPNREYVTITANSSNPEPIAITDWHVESYVTDSKASIPDGARTLKTANSSLDDTIFLNPGERAYLVTGETPLHVSFRENECTGYLAQNDNFYPSLKKSCPLPSDDLLLYGGTLASENQKCADFVADMKRCEIVSSADLNKANLTKSCDTFIEDVFDYSGCVKKHINDATFSTVGDWRIYLNHDQELWRSEREIIRLLDKEDRVVDVIEY